MSKLAYFDASRASAAVRSLTNTLTKEAGVPLWFRRTVNDAIAQGRIPAAVFPLRSGGAAVNHLVDTLKLMSAWDHHGRVRFGGHEVLVIEPYGENVTAKAMAEFEDVATRLGLAYLLSVNSSHFPGRTARIVMGQHSAVQAYRLMEWNLGNLRAARAEQRRRR